MWNKVADFIAKQGLLTPEGLHLVAVSGGADSVALLLVLKQLGYHVEAVHCNFHLRGEESDRDETFVKNLCSEQDVILHLTHFDTKEYAAIHQVSIEMAARALRYHYFEQLRQDIGAETVCVAHHRDDAVETLLMNLMRGAGIHGLTGIHSKNGFVVRPLLGIMPLMEQIQPGTHENIARSAYYLSEAEKVYNAGISREKNSLSGNNNSSFLISYSSLITSPSPLCLLHECLMPLGFNRTQIEQILASLDRESGRVFFSQTHTLVIDRDSLVVEPIREPMKPLVIPEPGRYRLDENTCFDVSLTGDLTISKTPDVATLDATCIQFPLTVRPVQQGDRFQPFGMQGQKLVSDFLTDQRLNLLEKRRQLVVTDATGTILWLVGRRIAHPFRVTDAAASILRIASIQYKVS